MEMHAVNTWPRHGEVSISVVKTEYSPDMDLCVCVCGQLENPLRWYCLHGWKRRRRRLIEGNAKSLRLKSDLEKDFEAGVYRFEAHCPPRFFLGV